LKFKLPKDEAKFMLAVKGEAFMDVLYELDQHLRAETKYAPDGTISEEVYNALDKTRGKIREIMSSYDISFDLKK
jgi:hypothetical protein